MKLRIFISVQDFIPYKAFYRIKELFFPQIRNYGLIRKDSLSGIPNSKMQSDDASCFSQTMNISASLASSPSKTIDLTVMSPIKVSWSDISRFLKL